LYVYFVRRLGYMVITLAIISVLGFIIINLPPGTYLDRYMAELQAQGSESAQEIVKTLEQRYRLNDPVFLQYTRWISGFVRGDFGLSFMYNMPVNQLIWGRIGYTVVIALATLIFVYAVSIPIGIYSAVNKYTIGDNVVTLFGFLGLSMPDFLLALILMVFAATFFDQPVGGLFSPAFRDAPWSLARVWDLLSNLWIPVVVIGTAQTATLIRVLRGNLSDVLNLQYVQTARSKGLSERIVIYKHAVRNAVHPLIMQLGMGLPHIISSSTVVAIVLSLPTMGPVYFRALRAQDMFLAGTFLMLMAILLVIGNFLADILLAIVDPRITYE